MKKFMLVALVSLFSVGVMAQAAPDQAASMRNSNNSTLVASAKNNPKKSRNMRVKSHTKTGPSTSRKKKGS